MTGKGHSRTCRIMILIMMLGMTPSLALADKGEPDRDRPIRLYATAFAGPIGTVNSLSTVVINGRTLYGAQTIWCGDLIQVPGDTSIRILLESVGQMTLTAGASLRVATRLTSQDGETVAPVLIASLMGGEINVKLQPQASAYIETGNTVITAGKGASFRLRDVDQVALVDTFVGEVHTQPGGFIVQRGKDRPPFGSRDVTPETKTITLSPREQERVIIQIKLKKQTGPFKKISMPAQDEYAKNLPIRFSVEPPTIGQLDKEVTQTDEDGIAETNFIAGNNRGDAKIFVTILVNPEEKYEVAKIIVRTSLTKRILNKRNILIAAGVIGASLIITHGDPSKKDPPIVIEP